MIIVEGHFDLNAPGVMNAVHWKANAVLALQNLELPLVRTARIAKLFNFVFVEEWNAFEIISTTIATWNNGFALFTQKKYKLQQWKLTFRTNRTLVASTANYPPFVYGNYESGPYDGIEYKILQSITESWSTKINYENNTINIYIAIVNKTMSGQSDVSFYSLWRIRYSEMPVDLSILYNQIWFWYRNPKYYHWSRLYSNQWA